LSNADKRLIEMRKMIGLAVAILAAMNVRILGPEEVREKLRLTRHG